MPQVDEALGLMRVALGREPADLLVRGVSLVNVYTAEIQQDMTVACRGPWIAYVGPEREGLRGEETTVIDGEGSYLAPGYIDGHTHWDTIARLEEYVRYSLPLGTTTVISEITDITHALGSAGMELFLRVAGDLPALVFALAPQVIMETVYAEHPPVSPRQIAAFLRHPRVAGLGEVYWPGLLAGDERILSLVKETRDLGKPPQGHSAGARGPKLNAYAAAGITSCHEPITPAEVVELLRLGFHVLARHGSIREDLPALGPLTDSGPDLRRLALASDTVWPKDLLEKGHMDWILRAAVATGFAPVEALRMVTLTVAEHFRLDHLVGGIAPGRRADMVLLPDLESFVPDLVIAGGAIVARKGSCTVDLRPVPLPSCPLRLPRIPSAADLEPPLPPGGPPVAIQVVSDMLTAQIPATGTSGSVPLNRAAVVDRRSGQSFSAFILGFGLREGAVATSMTWDGAHPVVVGASPGEMAFALQAVLETGGGLVACRDCRVLARLPLPVGGVVSDLPLPAVAAAETEWERATRQLGCELARPFLTLQTLTFTALPAIRITPRGLVDVRAKKLIPLQT